VVDGIREKCSPLCPKYCQVLSVFFFSLFSDKNFVPDNKNKKKMKKEKGHDIIFGQSGGNFP